jgi:hypothetical protein
MAENFEKLENIDKNDLNAIKRIAFNVCSQYLISWKAISINDFQIEKISYGDFFLFFLSYTVYYYSYSNFRGGLSNYLYRCQISNYESFKYLNNEPDKILLR